MELTIPIAFIFGVLSFFSPCVLPLIPGFFATFSNSKRHPLKARTIGTIFFVFGFSLVFIGLASVVSTFGSFLFRNLSAYRMFAGFLIMYFGVSLIFPSLQFLFVYEFKQPSREIINFYLKNSLFGISFAFGFTPCIGPVLGALLTLSSSVETIADGVSLLIWYSAGMGIPFILSSVVFNYFSVRNNFFKSFSRYSSYFSGVILFTLGSFIALDKIYIFSAMIQEVFYLLGLEFLATI